MQMAKNKIIEIFNNKIKNIDIIITKHKHKHDGIEGHWLESKFGVSANNHSKPDIYGYELKKESDKITFGDYSASEYIFSSKKDFINKANGWVDNEVSITRHDFFKYFGKPNPLKNNRLSWSGVCVPKYEIWNDYGQILTIDDNNICIYYSYNKDKYKENKNVPDILKNKKILIVIWMFEKIKGHIDKKFNVNGFIICKKKDNKYNKICFGRPFDVHYFLEHIQRGNIIFDSGMYNGNNRNYSQFRSGINNFWNNLIIEEYS
jgi:hypothetical protein